MKQLVWLSFDLGVNGDYENMYSWLDAQEAKECGDSMACFSFEYEQDLFKEIKKAIAESVSIDKKKDRIYVVSLVQGTMKGRFLIGKRRRAPWTGYAATEDQEEDLDV
ncbi:MAG TPA: hypothetical protein ENN65_01765 [Candidatus Hydrogenedentes bacterium]|mgnify:CR=1 FL=1|nr:hypothetical protein [Candidatus Hydrogenedentota bacterium]